MRRFRITWSLNGFPPDIEMMEKEFFIDGFLEEFFLSILGRKMVFKISESRCFSASVGLNSKFLGPILSEMRVDFKMSSSLYSLNEFPKTPYCPVTLKRTRN